MKHFLVLIIFIFLVIAVGAVAQTGNESSTSKDAEKSQAMSSQPTATPETVTKLPRKYPVAAGVWYPGDPLPKEPSRYYRVRCWPGCHSYGVGVTFPKSEEKTQTSY